MATAWEQTFRNWSKPSSDNECEKQERAERMVGEAIRAYRSLASRDIKIIPQGSYRNNTNVRQESDVDICVCCMEPFYDNYQFADYGRTELGLSSSQYSYAQFKADVHAALEAKFAQTGVTPGGKAFDVHANSCRVDADVVPAFAYRLYLKQEYSFLTTGHIRQYVDPPGTKFYSSSNKEIINWPEQHYSNGVGKNKRTANRFKLVVRAVKRLQFYLIDQKVITLAPIPSYLVECLLYNVPDAIYGGDSYADNVKNALLACFSATNTDPECSKWLEINEMKYLFHSAQPWTRQQAHDFVLAAWYYVEKH